MQRRCAYALGFLVLISGAALAQAPAGRQDVVVFISPERVATGGSLRAIAVAENALDATLTVIAPNGKTVAQTRERHGGPPYSWVVETEANVPGTYQACVDTPHACAHVWVGRQPREGAGQSMATSTRAWNRASEGLYAAWIEHLFDDPLDAEPSWKSLHEVTRDPSRNFLHDHLGFGEDSARGLRLEPDCADLPYFLRAYFAWKLRLPFAYSACSRGSGGSPPACAASHSMLEAGGGAANALARVQSSFHRLADGVQSGNGRAPASSDRGDFYPIRLTTDSLRPGTVYADPYGHMLILAQRIAQTPTTPGVLLAVDAQPDGTVARKRYWRGNFLFALDPALGSPGFKRFRPLTGAGTRALGNREVADSDEYGDYSLEQYEGGVEAFYDRVDAALSPQPLDPAQALRATIDAIEEQVRTRLRSVANGEEYVAGHRGVIDMPQGAAIFETVGAWEDYATPSRDLRLLIAIDVVRSFPAKVAAQPQRFAIPKGRSASDVRSDLEAMLRSEATARRINYTRSDGSQWTLTLADVLARAEALEVAYNPNDCVEIRWGASAGSELSTCRRHAPSDQLRRMASYREWFHERRRPPR